MVNPKELFGKDYEEFCEVDPFNPQNSVSGYVSRKSTELYGALIITKINEQELHPPQFIMGTPKIPYPFGTKPNGSRDYNFVTAKNIEVYEKLDGTNILSYFYHDGDTRFLTFKLRLRPFVVTSRWGDFLTMWNEVSSHCRQEIEWEMERSDCNLSFELYGSRNAHLVVYKAPLAFALLFGVTNTGRILSPLQDLKNPDLPIVERLAIIDKDYIQNYEELRQKLEAGLQQEEDGYYSGVEGAVWYLHTPTGECTQIKCKPETIETIHWSAGAGGLSKNIIIATCWNGFENADVLTVELINKLLLEEFEESAIEADHDLIERCVQFVNEEAEFKNKVIAEYKATGINILLNKREVMRQLSKKFPKGQMKKVHSTIMKFA